MHTLCAPDAVPRASQRPKNGKKRVTGLLGALFFALVEQVQPLHWSLASIAKILLKVNANIRDKIGLAIEPLINTYRPHPWHLYFPVLCIFAWQTERFMVDRIWWFHEL